MAETVALIKANPLLPAEDYNALRKQGIHSIEQLGSAIWTDYNNSDPGITILEAVAYAITELAYRTGFEIKDILAPQELTDDTWKQVFYTARKILHNNPLTINDFRMLMIDVTGVRNAWIEPSKDYEVPVWIDYNHWEQRKDHDCGCPDPEEKTCYGKLGFELVTPEQAKAENDKHKERLAKHVTALTEKMAAIQKKLDALILQQQKETDAAGKLLLQPEIDKLTMRIEAIKKEIERINQLIAEHADPKYIPSKIVEFEGLYNVMVEYEENVLEDEHREQVRQQVIDRLCANRNLCEDFLSINAVEYIDFGIKASIELEEYADADAVLAQVFFAIYRYFTPSVPFHTIEGMMEKGYSVDEIFNGPPLRHGFIDTTELEHTDLFRDIRLSDLINEIADIPGITAITYFHLPADAPEEKQYFNEWIRYLKEERKIARIQPTLSTVVFCKERDMITYNTGRPQDRKPERMLKLFRDLKTLERAYKLHGQDTDFPVPVGEYMELEAYYPVTYSLPMCYGVSERAGLSSDADQKRKVQALQLKGYMLFFEQLLVGYFAQLGHLRDLFTFDDSVQHTYFTKILSDLDGLQSLLIDHQNRGANNFPQILDDFTEVVENLLETPKLFASRRNMFLNHMLARFSEDLSEYEAISRWLTPQNVDERLIGDKIAILKDGEYYDISTERSEGYNYALQSFWDSPNISGTERRVSRLLGFRNTNRRYLAPDVFVTEPLMETGAKNKVPVQKKNAKGHPLYIVKLVDPEDPEKPLLTSVEVQEGCCIEELMSEIVEHADEKTSYVFHEDVKQRSRKSAGVVGSFWFELWDGPDPSTAVLLATSPKYDKLQARNQAYKRIQEIITRLNQNEGFHLIEHLLLRPKFDEVFDEAGKPIVVDFLNVCLDPCDLGKGLDEAEKPLYRKVVRRIPAALCYDKLPWVLEYMRYNADTKRYDQSILYQKTYTDATPPDLLKFRRYEYLAKRVRDLEEFGSERMNYKIVSNESEDPAKLKYGFIIYGNDKAVLAQSPYVFNKRTKQQKDNNITVENDIELEIDQLVRYFAFQLDLYCEENPCDHNEDPYSFRATVVVPCWPKRLRDKTFRNLFEKTLERESPAHIHTRVVWVGIEEMRRFEKVYYDWLEEMAQTEMPTFAKVDPLIDTLNTLRPCGVCKDECH